MSNDSLAHIPKLIEQLRDGRYWLRFPDRQVVAASLQAAWDRLATLTNERDELLAVIERARKALM